MQCRDLSRVRLSSKELGSYREQRYIFGPHFHPRKTLSQSQSLHVSQGLLKSRDFVSYIPLKLPIITGEG